MNENIPGKMGGGLYSRRTPGRHPSWIAGEARKRHLASLSHDALKATVFGWIDDDIRESRPGVITAAEAEAQKAAVAKLSHEDLKRTVMRWTDEDVAHEVRTGGGCPWIY